MPRRELLTAAQREVLLAFPDEEDNLLQHYVLRVCDLAFFRQHRGDHNRLGFAVQLCYLRYPGRVLAENERPPVALLCMVAAQLPIQSALWEEYAQRDETRREHLIELQRLYGVSTVHITGVSTNGSGTHPNGGSNAPGNGIGALRH